MKRFLRACAALFLGMAAWAGAAETPRQAAGFEGVPFTYTVEGERDFGAVTCRRVLLPSPVASPHPVNNVIPAEYYYPTGMTAEPRPAVVILHILGGRFLLERFFCLALARRGIPAVWFNLPYYESRRPAGIRGAMPLSPAEFIGALPQALADARRVADFLAAQPGVDPDRIGLLGTSMGALLGVPTLDADERFERAALFLGGGNLDAIIGHSRETRPIRAMLDTLPPDERARADEALASVEPLAHADRLTELAHRGKAFLVFAENDEVIDPLRSDELLDVLGLDRNAPVVFTMPGVGHYSALLAIADPLRRMLTFFGADDAPPATVAPSGPWEDAGQTLRDALRAVLDDAPEGRMTVWEADADGDRRLSVRRGPGGRVKALLRDPKLGEVGFGFDGERLWLQPMEGSRVVMQPSPGGDAVAEWRATPVGVRLFAPLTMAEVLMETPELGALYGELTPPDAEGRRGFQRFGATAPLLRYRLDDAGRLAWLSVSAGKNTYQGAVTRWEETALDPAEFRPDAAGAMTMTMPVATVAQLAQQLVGNRLPW